MRLVPKWLQLWHDKWVLRHHNICPKHFTRNKVDYDHDSVTQYCVECYVEETMAQEDNIKLLIERVRAAQ